MKRMLWLLMMLALPAAALAAVPTVINEQGTSGAPVSVGACSGAATKVIAGSVTSSTWSLMPEGADIRCQLGGPDDSAASPAPSATVGFLFKSNVIAGEPPSKETRTVTFRLDCCGVAGAVSVDTWRE